MKFVYNFSGQGYGVWGMGRLLRPSVLCKRRGSLQRRPLPCTLTPKRKAERACKSFGFVAQRRNEKPTIAFASSRLSLEIRMREGALQPFFALRARMFHGLDSVGI